MKWFNKLSKQQKFMLIGGAAVALFLVWRWQMSGTSKQSTGQDSSSTTGSGSATDPTGQNADQSAADYAALAGQEQSDVAALQDQNAQLAAQMQQADTSGMAAGAGSGDMSGLAGAGSSGAVGGGGGGFGGGTATPTGGAPLQSQVAPQATGQQKVNRARPQTIAVAANSPFARYYRQVTGQSPPARIQVTNAVLQLFRQGVKASAFEPPHPSAPNTRIKHPNPNHQPTGGAPVYVLPRARPPAPHHRAAPPARRK